MKLRDVILKAMAKKISWMEASEIAGITDRTMGRIKDRYQEFGYTGLFNQRRGKKHSARSNPGSLALMRGPMIAHTSAE